MGEQSKAVRSKLENMGASKTSKLADRFMQKLMSLGKKQPARKFEPYFIIEQVRGEMECSMAYQGQGYSESGLAFDTKWLYWVSNLESEDLRRHRKRTLFDFQFWNRGNFFPVRDYAGEVAGLE